MAEVKGRYPFLHILPFLLQFTSLLLLLLVLTNPAPFNGSDRLSSLTIKPKSLNSTTSASSNGTSSTYLLSTVAGSSTSSSQPRTTVGNATSSTPATSSIGASTSAASTSENATSSTGSSTATTTSSPARRGLATRQHKREYISDSPYYGGANVTSSNNTQTSRTSEQLSRIAMKLGPLGSCFRNALGVWTCTSAKLSSTFDYSQLEGTDVGFKSTGLPTGISTTPTLLLISLIALIVNVCVATPFLLAKMLPTKFGRLLETGPRERTLRAALDATFWLLVLAWLFIVGPGLSMRISLAKAKTAFNAANASLSLPLHSTTDGQTSNVTLNADIGGGFGLLWITLILLAASAFLMRKRAQRDRAVSQARADLESQYGRKLFESGGSLASQATAVLPQNEAAQQQQPPLYRRSSMDKSAAVAASMLKAEQEHCCNAAAAATLPPRHQHHHHHHLLQHQPSCSSSITALDLHELQTRSSLPHLRYAYGNPSPTAAPFSSYTEEPENGPDEVLRDETIDDGGRRMQTKPSGGYFGDLKRSHTLDSACNGAAIGSHQMQYPPAQQLQQQQQQQRSASPAPSYWTQASSCYNGEERERERLERERRIELLEAEDLSAKRQREREMMSALRRERERESERASCEETQSLGRRWV